MKRTVPAVLFLLLTFLHLAVPTLAEEPSDGEPTAPQWRWADFEVLGYRTVTRAVILDPPPVELGTPIPEEERPWEPWCEELEERLDLHRARCSPVYFAGGDGYLVIDVIEKGDEERDHFRPEPEGEVEIPAEVRRRFDALEARQMELFRTGTPPRESAEGGFLDYDEPRMHELVTELRELVPPLRERLLEAVATDADAEDRAAAARLLNWAGDVTDSIARVHRHLDDPSVLVRNNISRFTLHHVHRVESPEVRRSLVEVLCRQVARPSHADRNKALYSLLHLSQTFPGELPAIRAGCGEPIATLAERSVLGNVRDPAAELVAAWAATPPPR